ncbi:hypothetical protein HF325_000139 [Metschnikowia pulcherrima]|uniref:Uncharacterized protein n=1 Tax=Metschnikowia pulcherrima TaxID=27326 RepID=A0A8H7GXE3_9ASCO|nr:hypothetical protein HF325_000139 [Metschnikowia pulcherrima]
MEVIAASEERLSSKIRLVDGTRLSLQHLWSLTRAKSPLGRKAITSQEKWALARDLSQAQVKRRQLAGLLATRIRDFAINAKMNKYRKLISLSCGLRVEDIDGLIDGIEASLTEGSMQA